MGVAGCGRLRGETYFGQFRLGTFPNTHNTHVSRTSSSASASAGRTACAEKIETLNLQIIAECRLFAEAEIQPFSIVSRRSVSTDVIFVHLLSDFNCSLTILL